VIQDSSAELERQLAADSNLAGVSERAVTDVRKEIKANKLRRPTDEEIAVSAYVTGKQKTFINHSHLSFLFVAYKPQYWWWDVVETVRRLVFTALIVIAVSTQNIQVVFTILISILFVKLYGSVRPYEDGVDNRLQELSQYQVFLTLFCGLVILTDALDGEGGIYAALDVFVVFVNTFTLIITPYYIYEQSSEVQRLVALTRKKVVKRSRKYLIRLYTFLSLLSSWVAGCIWGSMNEPVDDLPGGSDDYSGGSDDGSSAPGSVHSVALTLESPPGPELQQVGPADADPVVLVAPRNVEEEAISPVDKRVEAELATVAGAAAAAELEERTSAGTAAQKAEEEEPDIAVAKMAEVEAVALVTAMMAAAAAAAAKKNEEQAAAKKKKAEEEAAAAAAAAAALKADEEAVAAAAAALKAEEEAATAAALKADEEAAAAAAALKADEEAASRKKNADEEAAAAAALKAEEEAATAAALKAEEEAAAAAALKA